MQVAAPMCYQCQNFDGPDGWKCSAFPFGIPAKVKLEAYDHRCEFPGDSGKRFQAKDEAAAEYVSWLWDGLLADSPAVRLRMVPESEN